MYRFYSKLSSFTSLHNTLAKHSNLTFNNLLAIRLIPSLPLNTKLINPRGGNANTVVEGLKREDRREPSTPGSPITRCRERGLECASLVIRT